MTTAQAYIEGWQACFAGLDGRYTNPRPRGTDTRYAWDHGFLDATEAEDGDIPEPECAGYEP